MSRKSVPLANYLVAWDEARIFKIGTSSHSRWRDFVIRGARLVRLHEDRDAYDEELAMHRTARQIWPRAFRSATEARPYLGSHGGGWLECYAGSSAYAELLFPHGYEHVPEPGKTGAVLHMQRTDGRTD
jgi:hypothetical protein